MGGLRGEADRVHQAKPLRRPTSPPVGIPCYIVLFLQLAFDQPPLQLDLVLRLAFTVPPFGNPGYIVVFLQLAFDQRPGQHDLDLRLAFTGRCVSCGNPHR